MGCVESRLERDLQTNIFNVVALESGQRRRCRLEVTETHLIQHERTPRAPTRWPLRCLRRYGFDADIFSFEAGRRCPTGPGIYYYKCRRAEALFNVLQLQIQNISDDTTSRDLASQPSAPEVRELREITRTDSRILSGAIDSHGYLISHPINSIIGVPMASPSLTAPSGANGGIGGMSAFSNIGGMRSPGSPPVPTSPPATTTFTSEVRDPPNSRVDAQDELRPPSTPGTDPLPRDVPSTPNETSRNVFMSYVDRTVSFINHNDRPSSYSSSGSERPTPLVNHMDRPQSYNNQNDRPASYLKVEPLKTSYGYVNLDHAMRCTNQHVYVNISTNIRQDNDHIYANLGLDKDNPIIPPRSSLIPGSGGSGSSHSGTTTTTDTDQQASQINYIQVDIDRGSDSSQTAPLSPIGSVASVAPDFTRSLNNMPTRSYAKIDFDKTEALSTTAKAMWETRAEGPRKTRHNSTANPASGLGRHNSTLSD